MLSPRQIELIQSSFAWVIPVSAETAATFYDRLFAFAPDTRRLFTSDMDEQGRKLFLTLATVVDALDRLDEITPILRELAVRHVDYGVRPLHYYAAGEALIAALRSALGTLLDGETEAAWGIAYTVLSGTMIDAARGIS